MSVCVRVYVSVCVRAHAHVLLVCAAVNMFR